MNQNNLDPLTQRLFQSLTPEELKRINAARAESTFRAQPKEAEDSQLKKVALGVGNKLATGYSGAGALGDVIESIANKAGIMDTYPNYGGRTITHELMLLDNMEEEAKARAKAKRPHREKRMQGDY
tara:strand:- start:247 stop:624 length:378 start_codon:yes stop_codon:yes gene_type:complete